MIKSFSIAGIKHSIELVDSIDNGESFGKFIAAGQKILIAKRVKADDDWYSQSDESLENTMWHEIMHAFQFDTTTDYDETQAQVFANFMCEFNKTSRV